jgi:hypothetical protein
VPTKQQRIEALEAERDAAIRDADRLVDELDQRAEVVEQHYNQIIRERKNHELELQEREDLVAELIEALDSNLAQRIWLVQTLVAIAFYKGNNPDTPVNQAIAALKDINPDWDKREQG